MRIKIRRTPTFWSLHSHSRFSAQDALPTPDQMVDTVADMGQPALGLTDHGNMAGSVQLYRACQRAGIVPFPGTEVYVVRDRKDKKAKRHHMCLVAYTSQGYENLVAISTQSHNNFFHKPILDFGDMAAMAEAGLTNGIAATSGCYFGFIAQAMTSNPAEAESLMRMYSGWFDKFYVELQNHNIDHGDGMTDSILADRLMASADSLGIPCILTQDSHYCHPEDKPVHETMKRLVAWGPDDDDAVFPGDGFHLASQEWMEDHHHPERLNRGLEGLADLLSAHDLKIKELDSYRYNIPFTVPDPMATLRTRCNAALMERKVGTRYDERLSEELSVISDTGMAGYLVLVAEVTDWCRDNSIFYQARGSASGSIVCWLLGITQADPIKWKLSFDRFISRDRTSPPDIDLDIEHDRRRDLIEWLGSRFAIHQIGTWRHLSLDAQEDEDGEQKGSIRVKYYARVKATGAERLDWGAIPLDDRMAMYELSKRETYDGYGVHPAGMVVTTVASDFDRLVPMMYVASSKTMVTQYPMDDIEALGLVKLDVLGLKTLTVLSQTMRNLDRDPFAGLDWIPLTDSKTYAEISKGNTSGVFQLEGGSARRGVKELKPSKVSDVIAAMALFRPATMNSGATTQYIERKHRQEEIPHRHHILMDATKDTYGIFLFQEQVIHVLREMGMEASDLTKFLKAVKASNSNIGGAGRVIQGYHDFVMSLAIGIGMSEEDFDWLWESVTGFAAYGFNQAHSTAYGITAYRCAYLATNHPVEFYAALLSVAAGNKDKEPQYVRVVRGMDIRLMRPHVNYSGVTYSVDPRGRGIRRGLMAIKGVGRLSAEAIVAARDTTPFSSLSDFAHRVDHRKITGVKPYLEDRDLTVGVFGKLYDSGALDELSEK